MLLNTMMRGAKNWILIAERCHLRLDDATQPPPLILISFASGAITFSVHVGVINKGREGFK